MCDHIHGLAPAWSMDNQKQTQNIRCGERVKLIFSVDILLAINCFDWLHDKAAKIKAASEG